MSAFMHDSAHIDALVSAVVRYAHGTLYWGAGTGPTQSIDTTFPPALTRAGKMLLRENAESMKYRYNLADLDNENGDNGMEYLGYLTQVDEYVYDPDDTGKPWRMLPPVALLQALDSYEYQACERPEWEGSDAHAFCESLRSHLIGSLPGYQEAQTWAITAPRTTPTEAAK